MKEAMHIARIDLENFKAHAQLVVENPGTFTLASGKNRTGKTSLLDSIKALVEGAGAECIKTGEKSATIKMRLGDNIEATRTINGAGKGKLKVVSDGKFTVNAPKEFLADVLGASNFRPLAFFSMDGAGRKKAVLETVQVECTDDDWRAWGIGDDFLEVIHELGATLHPLELVKAVEKTIYDDRAKANKTAKLAAENAAAAKPADAGAVTDAVRSQTAEQIRIAQEAVAAAEASLDTRAAKAAERARMEAQIERHRATSADAKAEIERLQQSIERHRAAIDLCDKEIAAITTMLKAEAATDTSVDMVGLRSALLAAQSEDRRQQEVLSAEAAWQAMVAEAQQAKAAADALDATLTTIRDKALPTLLERAHLPIEGLSIGENDVLYNGVEASQLSGSERLWIGLQVAKSAAGDAGVICLDGIEQLDAETFAKLIDDTRGDGYQYFATRVADTDLEITDAHNRR